MTVKERGSPIKMKKTTKNRQVIKIQDDKKEIGDKNTKNEAFTAKFNNDYHRNGSSKPPEF